MKGRIITTLPKAKEVRPLVEKCITIARSRCWPRRRPREHGTDAERNSEAWKTWRKSDKWKRGTPRSPRRSPAVAAACSCWATSRPCGCCSTKSPRGSPIAGRLHAHRAAGQAAPGRRRHAGDPGVRRRSRPRRAAEPEAGVRRRPRGEREPSYRWRAEDRLRCSSPGLWPGVGILRSDAANGLPAELWRQWRASCHERRRDSTSPAPSAVSARTWRAGCPSCRTSTCDRVAIGICQTRNGAMHGVFATLTPLRFAGGRLDETVRGRRHRIQPLVDAAGQEFLYLLNFYLPRFLNLPLEEKLSTIVHELWHIGPQFDGDLRRHDGPLLRPRLTRSGSTTRDGSADAAVAGGRSAGASVRVSGDAVSTSCAPSTAASAGSAGRRRRWCRRELRRLAEPHWTGRLSDQSGGVRVATAVRLTTLLASRSSH